MTSIITWTDPAREQAFYAWLTPLTAQHGLQLHTLRPASADASFRRYFRIDGAAGPSLIIMDAPPPQEDVRPFVHIAQMIQGAGLNGPDLLAVNESNGFLLLSDLGQQLYLDALRQADTAQADALMRQAITTLVQWQVRIDASSLPRYDSALLDRELALFPEWCVQREFGITWTPAQRDEWTRIAMLLTASALAQPRVAVHRDWMPRNLMVGPQGPNILDFQDAVNGPVTYDIASMLRDAFISWDEDREVDWATHYWQSARDAGVPLDGGFKEDFGEFWRALEYMGLQRHLKVMGIFCRLKHRDGKLRYAEDLPRFFNYATGVAVRYRQLQPLLPLLEQLLEPMYVALPCTQAE